MRVKKKEQPSKRDYDECRRLREEHGAAQTPSSGSAAAFGGCGVLFLFSPSFAHFFITVLLRYHPHTIHPFKGAQSIPFIV